MQKGKTSFASERLPLLRSARDRAGRTVVVGMKSDVSRRSDGTGLTTGGIESAPKKRKDDENAVWKPRMVLSAFG